MLTITNEDNMVMMARYPDKYFDLAIVDPPYGINVGKMAYLSESNTTVKQKNGTRLKPRKTIFKKKDWDSNIPNDNFFKELFRVSKNQIIWGINYMNLDNIGLGRINWNKCVPDGLSFKKYEHAYCSLIDSEVELILLHSGFNRAKSLSEPHLAQKDFRKILPKIHPTEKPILLYKKLLSDYAKPNDKILDTHLGSGSIAIACHDYGFDLTACELDKEYYDKAMQRINNHTLQTKLF